jgi:ketosteroid isomerase-like protein
MSPSSKEDDEMTDAKAAAVAAWQAFATRDPERIRQVFTEDATWIAPPENATALALGMSADDLTTVDGIVRLMTREFRKLFPDGADFEFTKVLADGDTVVFEQRMRATTVGGRSYDNRYCWVFEMQDGKVKVIREYMDTHGGHRMIFAGEPPRKLVA